MGAIKGYYSLIQYCPDMSRLEAANVGVVVFCPERAFVRAKVTRDNDRIRKFFGSSDDDWAQIRTLKLAVEKRFETEAREMKTLDDFRRFAESRANELQITQPRPMKVLDPDADLQRLFEQLVGGRAQRAIAERQSTVFRYLDRSIRDGGISHRVWRDVEVEVPAFHRRIKVPFGFSNGMFNLIKPFDFRQETESGIVRTACELAVEGRSLFKNPDTKLGQLHLVVVGRFVQHSIEHEDVVNDILAENDVTLYPLSAVDDLVDTIRRTAKPVTVDHEGSSGDLL